MEFRMKETLKRFLKATMVCGFLFGASWTAAQLWLYVTTNGKKTNAPSVKIQNTPLSRHMDTDTMRVIAVHPNMKRLYMNITLINRHGDIATIPYELLIDADDQCDMGVTLPFENGDHVIVNNGRITHNATSQKLIDHRIVHQK